MIEVEYTKLADQTILDALIYWARHHPAAPEKLEEDLDKALELIKTFPEMAPVALTRKFPGARKLVLGDTGHILLYRVVSKKRLRILALLVARKTTAQP